MKKYKIKFIVIFLCSLIISCSNNEQCEYEELCIESCELFEDFENKELGASGNWLGIALGTDGVLFETRNNSTSLHANDGSGGSFIYNNSFFSSNDLTTLGCELTFDIEYVAGGNNGAQVKNVIRIYDGNFPNPPASSIIATFVLNNTNAIVDNSGQNTISVPIELGVGNLLPSNSFGSWLIAYPNPSSPGSWLGVTSTTASDISNFNNLIQNIGGTSFWLDVVNTAGNSAPTEQWWFDNFCFTQCCTN